MGKLLCSSRCGDAIHSESYSTQCPRRCSNGSPRVSDAKSWILHWPMAAQIEPFDFIWSIQRESPGGIGLPIEESYFPEQLSVLERHMCKAEIRVACPLGFPLSYVLMKILKGKKVQTSIEQIINDDWWLTFHVCPTINSGKTRRCLKLQGLGNWVVFNMDGQVYTCICSGPCYRYDHFH